MHLVRSVLVFSAAVWLARGEGELALPPLDGTFGGEVSVLGEKNPSLHWSVTCSTGSSGRRRFSARLEGKGARASAKGEINSAENEGIWEIEEVRIDLADWFPAVAARYFPRAAAYAVNGKLSGEGRGALNAATPTGELRLALDEGNVSDATAGWNVAGIHGTLVLPNFTECKSAPGQRLQFGSIAFGELTLEHGTVEYEIESITRIRVNGARLYGLGGTVDVGNFVLDLDKNALEARLLLHGVELSALQRYLPKAIVEAHGRVDGDFILRWNATDGVQVGDGSLQLRQGEPATIRLATTPGFLSAHVPERINLLPSWLGPIARNVSKAFEAHQTLESIESGRELLILESIQAELRGSAQGNDAGATVKLVARPTKTNAVKAVRLNINVTGPLADLIRYGLNGQLSFGAE